VFISQNIDPKDFNIAVVVVVAVFEIREEYPHGVALPTLGLIGDNVATRTARVE